jgi:hypothetical protein
MTPAPRPPQESTRSVSDSSPTALVETPVPADTIGITEPETQHSSDPSTELPKFENVSTSFVLILDDPETPEPSLSPEPSGLDPVVLQDLITERDKLRRELRELDRRAAEMARIPLPDAPSPPEEAVPGERFAGTIRDLNLSGASQKDVEVVMRKRGMRFSQSLTAPGVSQSFLSGATGHDGQRYTARSSGRNEIVNALVISPATIRHMASLERQELEKRGLDPARTLVRRIVFGIVGSGEAADLGVVLFDAIPVN